MAVDGQLKKIRRKNSFAHFDQTETGTVCVWQTHERISRIHSVNKMSNTFTAKRELYLSAFETNASNIQSPCSFFVRVY